MLTVVVLSLGWCDPAAFASATPDAFAVIAEVDRLAVQPMWPGFAPQQTPIAVYDGSKTLLFRHPHPPEGFRPVDGHAGVLVFDGLFSGVRSNTSTDLGGVRTATAMLNKGDRSVRQNAALLLHELFHVYQREYHKDWIANEGELFLYPFDDPTALQLRRLESGALTRALAAVKSTDSHCWASAAMRLRQQRFARLPEGSVNYERFSELNEGLANYIQDTAAGITPSFPPAEFAIDQIRDRFYVTGPAMAFLLDRIDAGWKKRFDESAGVFLDATLRAALVPASPRACDFSPQEREAALTRARADVDGLREHRAELRDQFFSKPGWKLVVTGKPGVPLFPQGFDPLNVDRLDARQILHRRWLKIGNAAGNVEVLDRASVTEGAGEHPLFNGIRALTIAGLTDEPAIREENGAVTVQGDGVHGEFKSARVTRNAQEITITLQ